MAVRQLLYFNQTNGGFSQLQTSDSITVGLIQAAGVSGVALDAGGNRIVNLADPQAASDPATKGYADAISQGVTFIESARVLANTNQALSGLPTIDGITLRAGDTVLLTAQTNAVENGKWVVAAGAWSRPTGASGKPDYTTGRNASSLAMFIREGNTFAEQGWTCTTDGNPKVDTDPVQFIQFTALGEVLAGAGLQKGASTGNTISILLAAQSALQFTGGALDTLLNAAGGLKKDGSGLAIVANANQTVAVDAQGLRTLGLPSTFTIAGSAVSSAVSAANLNTLTGGTSSLADGLHQHTNVLSARANSETLNNGSTALSAGDPVCWGATNDTLMRGDNTSTYAAFIFGIASAAIAANGSGTIVRRGIATGVLSQATAGTPYYLNQGGGLTATIPTASTQSAIRVGIAKNSTDLDVNIQQLIVRT